MSEDTSRSSIANKGDHVVAKTVSQTLPLIRAAVLVVSVAAAVPTAYNLYYSWQHGIPYSEVPHRLSQYDLWMKNLDCRVEYRQLLTTSGTKVDVGACGKSGDIAIKITGTNGQATYEWIAYEKLKKPTTTTASLIEWLVPAALAAGLPVAQPVAESSQNQPTPAAGSTKLAQAAMQVKCQTLQGGDKVIRIIQEGNKCFRETVSILKGSIDKREEVACTTTCTK